MAGTAETVPNAKSRKSGPEGCQSKTVDATDPAAATSALSSTSAHGPTPTADTSAPSPTAVTSDRPAVHCMAARGRCTRLRP